MTAHKFERLSAQDFSFLVFESPNIHTHVGATQIFEAGPMRTADGGINAGLYKRIIESVLHLIPRYRQKLMWTPIENRPVWVDDAEFNLDYHIRHTALPSPGSDEQLKELTARIMGRQLDRSRPLWEVWVVEGLDGDRFAVISKLHHCMVDGTSGVDIAHLTLSPTPKYELRPPRRYVPHLPPTRWELLQDTVFRRLSLPVQLARGWSSFRRETQDLGHELRVRARAVADVLGWATLPRAESPFNGSPGPHRRFDWLTTSLDACKAISKATGRSINDVVLAVVTGAVREFFIYRRVHPGDVEFRVATPVNVRRADERGRMGNRVSSWLMQLPIGEADPRKRLDFIHEQSEMLKASHQALGVDIMMSIAEWQPAVLLSLGVRATNRSSNMTVTNVPGPPAELYLLGARLLEMYSVVPLLENQGMGITVLSYARKMCWGFNASLELLPDLRVFVNLVDAAFQELTALAVPRPVSKGAAAPVAESGKSKPTSKSAGTAGERQRSRRTLRVAVPADSPEADGSG